MSKKKNTLGKLVAFTTAVGVAGGVCYAFRNQIKANPIYQKTTDKLSQLLDKLHKDDTLEDDFYFDDEDDVLYDMFSEEAKNSREYTSITINPSEDKTKPEEAPQENAASVDESEGAQTEGEAVKEKSVDTPQESEAPKTEPVTTPQESEASKTEPVTTPKENEADTDKSENTATEEEEDTIPSIPTISHGTDTTASTQKDTVTGYEYEGLSDVSEDPEVLEEQDSLDF